MGESIISERLRRLREEGEQAEKDITFTNAKPLARPTGDRRRTPDYKAVEIVEKVMALDEAGKPSMVVTREAAVADLNSSPFEYLVHRGWARAKDEPESVAEARVYAARRLRSLHDGAQVRGLKSQAFEITGTGSRGLPAAVGDTAIDCMKILGDVRVLVPPTDMQAVEDVVLRDIWIWDGKKGKAIFKEVDRVLRGLDYVAMSLGYLTAEEIVQRWPLK